MTRKEQLKELTKSVDKDTLTLLTFLIEHIDFLETQLNELKLLPFIQVKAGDTTKQRLTPAYKQYKELSQTYLNSLKVLMGALGIDEADEESPLRKWFNERVAV